MRLHAQLDLVHVATGAELATGELLGDRLDQLWRHGRACMGRAVLELAEPLERALWRVVAEGQGHLACALLQVWRTFRVDERVGQRIPIALRHALVAREVQAVAV